MNDRKTTTEHLSWNNSGRRISSVSRRQLIAVALAVALCAGLTNTVRAVPLCGAGLRMNCQVAGSTGLIINSTAHKRLGWKWLKGAATTLQSFGVPTSSTAYALCIYAGTSTAAVAEVDIAPSPTLWHPTGTAGFSYRDPHGSSDGVRNVILKPGAAGEAKAVVRGGGANLPAVPAGPLPLPVTAQLVNNATDVCFEEVYDNAVVKENDAERFKASTTATDLYVADSGSLSGRGSVAHPYRRITDAVVRARAERAAAAIHPGEKIRIHVAPGTYVGSFDPTELATHPEYEVLPIVLNVPRLALLGSTVLTRDERGLPTATSPGSETIVAPDTALAPNQYLLLVTRTADGGVGDGVTVDGFVFDGKDSAAVDPGADVFIDRVSDFRFTNNLVERSGFGVMTRLASGTIEGNLLANNLELGSIVTGGSRAHPATVLIRANRATRNTAHGIGCPVGGWIRLVTDPGGNSVPLLEPLQTTFDRNSPADVENIPDTLSVTLDGNDVSDNGTPNSLGGIGIRLSGIWPKYTYTTTDPSQPVTSSLVANVIGNTCDRNGAYGVAIEAADTQRTEPRRFIQSLAGNFQGNVFDGNNRAPALFTFTYWLVSIGKTPQLSKKFAEASSYTITDADGEFVTFDYDNPLTDPLNGTVLDNTLTLNGVEVPHGKSITPAQ